MMRPRDNLRREIVSRKPIKLAYTSELGLSLRMCLCLRVSMCLCVSVCELDTRWGKEGGFLNELAILERHSTTMGGRLYGSR